MKKVLILLSLLLLVGCNKDNIEIDKSTSSLNTTNTEHETLTTVSPSFEEITYVEDIENGTTITLKDENTFETVLNVCTGFVNLSGEYTIEEDILTLTFPNETGFFLDEEQPYRFSINENGLEILDGKSFSCGMVDKYSVMK